MLNGTVYGIVLNDRAERERLAAAFVEPPYKAPPVAPVLYVRPRGCAVPSGCQVALPGGRDVSVAATLGLVIGRDLTRTTASDALAGVAGVRLALDVSKPHASYYRPAVAERCRDGFLPLGAVSPMPASLADVTIETAVDGEVVHRWSLSRLAVAAPALIEAVTAFMTLAAGDLLLIGLAGDAPLVAAGRTVRAEATGVAWVEARLAAEAFA